MSREAKATSLRSNLRLIGSYFAANFAMEVEYRAAFFTRVFSMLVNDCMWLTFWIFYFDRFRVVRGWERLDVITLWAMIGFGYGLGMVVFGNCMNLSRIIYNGELDVYLTQPRNVLLHTLIGRTSASLWGDIIFGLAVFAFLGEPTMSRSLLFLYGGVLTAIFHASFVILMHSLAFWTGNAETLAAQAAEAMIHYSTYPTGLFDGWVKVILFTVIPAGFVSHMPVGLIRDFNWPFFLEVTAAAGAVLVLAVSVFFRGLRQYESGNLVQTRM